MTQTLQRRSISCLSVGFQGVITSLSDDEGIVNATEHGDVPFDICENFSDTEFSSNDIQKEVEFTIAMVSMRHYSVRRGSKSVFQLMILFCSCR